jgi:hypothetical protein
VMSQIGKNYNHDNNNDDEMKKRKRKVAVWLYIYICRYKCIKQMLTVGTVVWEFLFLHSP